ncbi:hypothetical protein GGH91_002316 [Coemansia sp. RSA 2671]|nr:hypothetical protein LPJ60_005044 [Coemansia sp. RSA 2675]KAJ2346116.1 hypothetical protein GGH91_002316 [Coemansia sp. RSA 2671]
MELNVVRAERTLSLLTNTYLANTDSVKTSVALVLDTVLSQNLFAYVGATGVTVETTKRYESAVHKWIARVSSLLVGKSSESRMAGILLVKHTTLQSPPIFVENATKWTTSLLNMLGKADIAAVHAAALQLLLVFMDIVREVPELDREITSAQVPRMNQAVLALADKNPELVDAALELLMYSASWFPKTFRPSIDKTEALCLRLLNGSMAKASGTTCKRAANCLASMPLVGGKVTVEERWFQYVLQTVGTIETCVDHVMCAETPAANAEARQTMPGMPAFADDFIVSIPQAADRITSMTELVVALLSRPVNVDVPIPVDGLVAVASKLALVPVRVANSKSNRAEFGLVPLLAPQLQRAAIRIMAVLAIALGDYMQPFLSAVARAMTAINTRHLVSATTQVALYSLVQLYVERYGYGFVICLPKELIASAISDLNVQSKRQVSATAGSALSASLSSKKRGGRSRATEVADSEGASNMLQIQYTDVVYSALKTVLALLKHTPTVLNSSLRAQIDGQVLTLLMLETVGGLSSPAASCSLDARYQVALCQCLEASIMSPDPWQKAVVPHAVSIFSAGLDSPSVAVRDACSAALANIEPIIHARLPAQLRAPETEKDIEQEYAVPKAVLDSQVSLSAGLDGSAFAEPSEKQRLSAEELHEQEVEEDEREVEANTKRFKNFSVQPVGTRSMSKEKLQLQQTPSAFAASPPVRVSPTPAPAAPAVVSAQSETSMFAPSKPATLSANPVATPSAAKQQESNEDGDEDDDIPDIVMEGSDSEDE